MTTEAEGEITTAATEVLVGRRVIRIRYMLQSEALELEWSKRPVVLEFDDGTIAFVASDEEANDAGALFVQTKRSELCIGRFPA